MKNSISSDSAAFLNEEVLKSFIKKDIDEIAKEKWIQYWRKVN